MKSLTNPHLVATYINGYIKEINLAKKSMEEIHNDMIYIVSSFGKKDIRQMGKNVFGPRKTIQGRWTSATWFKGPEH